MSLATASVVGFERAATSSLDRVRASFAGLSTSTKVLGGLGLGLAALAVGIGQVIGPAIEFESAFAGVLKTVDGSTAQLGAIRTGLLNLSTVMPTSASDLAAIAENAGQLGIQAPKVLEFTEVIAQLGETTDLDFEQAAQSLARFLNVTGDQASITQLGDVIVELGNNSATTESQIVTFATRLASAFTVAGASEDQILALGAAFSSLGIEAEAGSSSLNRVITQIADAAKLGGQDLEIFAETAGVLPEKFAEIARENPVEALVLFGEGLRGVTEEGRSITPILERLELSGIRTSRVLQLLALGSDDIRVSLALAEEQFLTGGAAAEEFARRAETTESRLALLQNRLQAVAIAAGTPLLDTFARGADLAGDAVERLIQLLAPLTDQGAETFRNLAQAAGLFFDVIGGPALGVAVAALNGLVITASTVLGVFNALGPPGIAVAAAIGLIATAAPAASVGVGGLALAIQVMGVRSAATTAIMQGFNSTLLASPVAPLVASLALVGAAFFDAGQKGREFAQVYRNDVTDAISAGDFDTATASIQALVSEQQRLQEVVGNQVAFEVGAVSVRDFSASLSTLVGFLPGVGSEVSDNEAKLRELNSTLAENGWGLFDDNVRLASNALGLSNDSILTTAAEIGVLEELVAGTSDEFFNAVDAIDAATEAERRIADQTGILADKILAGTASLEDYQEALGLTGAELQFLANKIDSVEIEDLLDPDKAEVALAAIESLAAEYSNLADELGLTLPEFQAQSDAVGNLAAAHSELRQAVEGTLSAYQLIDEQQRITATSQEAYNEALAGIDGSEESIRAAAVATQELSANSAALAGSASEAALNQEKLVAELVATAVAEGASVESVARLIAQYGVLNEASLGEIQREGELLQLQNEALEQSAEDLAKEYLMTLLADGDQARDEIEDINGQVGDFTDAEWVAFLEANGLDAEAEISARKSQAEDWRDSPYEGQITAEGGQAEAEISAREAQASAYKAGDYVAAIRARDDNASSNIELLRAAAQGYAKPYSSTLRAVDQASGTIFGAVAALRGFRSKTIYLRTVTVARRGPSGGGNSFFADGGISDIGSVGVAAAAALAPRGAIPERPGPAKIYQPVTPGRFFAEPVTGGESYIPLSQAKRGSAIPIWMETGRILGVLANGGIQQFQNGGFTDQVRFPRSTPAPPTQPNISVGIDFTINAAPGMNEERVVELAGAKFEQVMNDITADLGNVRIG